LLVTDFAPLVTTAARATVGGVRPPCAHCGGPVFDGNSRTFCSTRCRVAAHRRRQAGIPENALRFDGRRGRLSLAESFEREQLAIARAELEAARRVLDETPDYSRFR
jgi:hypothetical protein